jgi:hypothetical protein
MKFEPPKSSMLYRTATLIGIAFAVLSVGLALSGFFPGLLLLPIGIALAGWRTVARYIN